MIRSLHFNLGLHVLGVPGKVIVRYDLARDTRIDIGISSRDESANAVLEPFRIMHVQDDSALFTCVSTILRSFSDCCLVFLKEKGEDCTVRIEICCYTTGRTAGAICRHAIYTDAV
jgi:hypothetical protein